MAEQTPVTGEEKKTEDETVPKKEQSKKMKWLNRVGHFMMMGGFLLVLILGVVIYIVIATTFHCK